MGNWETGWLCFLSNVNHLFLSITCPHHRPCRSKHAHICPLTNAVGGRVELLTPPVPLLTSQNPLKILVEAIANSGPREDSTRIGRAGTVRRQAVDVSPLRRVNQAIYLLCTGAREASFRNIKTISECLADELINAAKVTVLAQYRMHANTRTQHTHSLRANHPLLNVAYWEPCEHPCGVAGCTHPVCVLLATAGLIQLICHQEEG